VTDTWCAKRAKTNRRFGGSRARLRLYEITVIRNNRGTVHVGASADTAAFAVDANRRLVATKATPSFQVPEQLLLRDTLTADQLTPLT
jgi:hypothetical protein